MGKKIHPDIEEATDVSRYCINSLFPLERAVDGTVLTVFACSGHVGDRIVGQMMRSRDTSKTEEKFLSFEEFLSIDTGPWKSHMIEWEDSLVYVWNTSPASRNHGFTTHWEAEFFYKPYARSWDSWNIYQHALACLSYKRTPFSTGIRRLTNGDCVGIALSDRFGIITTDDKEHPLIVYKRAIIGHVEDERPIIKPAYSHLYPVVLGLCSK